MQGYNVLLIYNVKRDKILMCKRGKEPFKGLYNLNGGKIEAGEDGLSAAYREMYEETGIIADDIDLFHLMDFTYYFHDLYVEVYVGNLKSDARVKGDENELVWIDADSNFFDTEKFGGDGNIWHIVKESKNWTAKLFGANGDD